MTQTHARHHSHWGAFTAIVEDGRVVGVTPFEHDPNPSELIEAIPAAVHSDTRIAQPMVREGWLKHGPGGGGAGRGREAFVPVPWERALDLVAGELARVKAAHGPSAIMGGSQGWGSAGLFHEARVQVRRFLASFGGFVDQSSNYSFGAALIFLPHILGSPQAVVGPMTSWSSIARHGQLMVLFGGANPKNTQVAKGGCAYHGVGGRIEAMGRAGVKIVNVSPIRDDGPGVAPEWIAIRPNTDTAMILALAHTLIAEGLHDQDFLDRYCTGYDRVRPYLMGQADGQPKDADWAERITGVPAATIRELARRMAAQRTMLTCSWSIQRADHGEQPYWALVLLAAALGQIGLPGGGFGFGYGSSANVAEPPLVFPGPAMDLKANPAGLSIPGARIADCLLHPGEQYESDGKTATYPDIKLVYWAGGNPFHHHQDLNRLRRAWSKPETIIVHEPWWTATARLADIVLPATTSLERNDIGCSARDRYVMAMHKAIQPVGDARDDFAILRELAVRLGCAEAFTEGLDEDGWLRRIYGVFRDRARSNLVPEFDDFWAKGYLEIPPRTEEYELFAEFRADPERNKLHTPSGRIELYSERIAGFGYDDCPPHPTWIEPAEWLGAKGTADFPLHLVSSQPRYKLHSQMDSGPVSALGKVAGREAVSIHPADANARGIAAGDVVRVFNRRGACYAGAVISESVRPGVVKLSCGAWWDPQEGAEDAACAHGNANVLTRDHGTSRLGQGPSSATALVEIERARGDVPAVTAFAPPRVAEALNTQS